MDLTRTGISSSIASGALSIHLSSFWCVRATNSAYGNGQYVPSVGPIDGIVGLALTIGTLWIERAPLFGLLLLLGQFPAT